MVFDLKTSNCSGCGVCCEICPMHAIEMVKNECGFSFPQIDANKCISCGKCKRLCEGLAEVNSIKKAFILRHSQAPVYDASQSGGAFTLFSDYILSNSGIVYGAHLNDRFSLSHIRATSEEERNLMHGSIYIQCDAYKVFNKVAADLEQDFNVMFIGTPCQVSGLKKYLKDKRVKTEKLFLVDLLCHGVASTDVWKKLIAYYEEKCGYALSKIDWCGSNEQTRPYFTFRFGKKSITDSQFKKLYYSNLMMRTSCYQCPFTKLERSGDVSIGDATGIRVSDNDFYNPKGTSLVLINTYKGMTVWESVKRNANYREVNIGNYLQECLRESAKTKRNPDEFWQDYATKGIDYILKKYVDHKILLNLRYIFHRLQKVRR